MTPPKRVQTLAGRHYEVGKKKYPSVTSILGVLGKPALINWAARVEREMVMAVSSDLYFDSAKEKIEYTNRAGWLKDLEDRLGKEKAHKKILDAAADIGTQAHNLAEWTTKKELGLSVGAPPIISNPAQLAFDAWNRWRESINLKPLQAEQAIWSDTYGYAGTMDLLAELNGEVIATNYFTGKSEVMECDGVLALIDYKTGKSIYPEAFLQNAAYRNAVREMNGGDPQTGLIVRLPKTVQDPNFEVMWCPPEEECMEVFLHAKKLWEWQKKYDKWLQAHMPPAPVEEKCEFDD